MVGRFRWVDLGALWLFVIWMLTACFLRVLGLCRSCRFCFGIGALGLLLFVDWFWWLLVDSVAMIALRVGL